jgi:hypothetical protein
MAAPPTSPRLVRVVHQRLAHGACWREVRLDHLDAVEQ